METKGTIVQKQTENKNRILKLTSKNKVGKETKNRWTNRKQVATW